MHPIRSRKPQFPVIDYHNHLDAQTPLDVLRVMDACGIEKNCEHHYANRDAALAQIRRYRDAASERFATIGWMDWDGVDRSDFTQLSLDRLEKLVEHGACGIKFWKDLGLTVRDAVGRVAMRG